jgi:hypothetical protein
VVQWLGLKLVLSDGLDHRWVTIFSVKTYFP